MKFKTIFILFNVVVGVSFLFVFLMPFFVLGASYSLEFWKGNWPLALFFVAVLAVLNVFYASNRVVLSLVEREDWNGLSSWLSTRVFDRGILKPVYVRFLVSTALNRSDLATIDRLEAVLREKKPALLARNAVLFGVVYLLRNDAVASERFFSGMAGRRDADSSGWLSFDHGFSLVLLHRESEAVAPLKRAAGRSSDAVLVLLASYLLGTMCAAAAAGTERDALDAFASGRRRELAKRYGPERWSREIERARGEVHIVILTKLVDEASRWLRQPDAPGA